ncbi:FecR domain-containing protein [Chitinophaga pollutisoli]|uniref:FecR domain-containing protein n=1 Tax=Chitinophaga pollutisoli TaxID=3133966 RepID=A0ABZ2YLQ8_9BACT
MDKNEAKQLIEKYLSGTCTPEEKAYVEKAYNRMPAGQAGRSDDRYQRLSGEIWENIVNSAGIKRQAGKRRRLVYVAAAALLAGLAIGNFFLLPGGETEDGPAYERIADVAPGGNKAVLVLEDGRKVPLDSGSASRVNQYGSTITITDSTAEYAPQQNSADPQVVHAVVTPKGGQFQLKLSDGTKVMLNAASTLTFAPNFKGHAERIVRLSGEAYFEVAHDAQHPFIVETDKQRVKVLGTRFNIHSYPDEYAVTTSLLEGSVEISTSLNSSKILNPGQAATTENESTRIVAADENAVAWTSGQIRFRDADLKAILLPVSRWYDLKVIYERPPSPELYTGGILKKNSLSTFLKMLDSREVRYELRQGREGKELIIK